MRWRLDPLCLRERYPPPDVPFTPKYAATQRALIAEALADGPLQCAFADDRRLPRFYGVGLDERVVELPWLLSRLHGHTLDAGSSLNHEQLLDRVLTRVTSLHIVTATPEEQAFPGRGVSYLFADFRELPYRDGYFDTVACISSLEHVGMDNSRYGGPSREPDPDATARAALDELRRVLTPGGTLLITVPYGAPGDHGWFRQYGSAEVGALAHLLGPQRVETSVFAYSRDGWQRSSPTAAVDARYRDWHADPRPVADLAAAARAVACIQARR